VAGGRLGVRVGHLSQKNRKARQWQSPFPGLSLVVENGRTSPSWAGVARQAGSGGNGMGL